MRRPAHRVAARRRRGARVASRAPRALLVLQEAARSIGVAGARPLARRARGVRAARRAARRRSRRSTRRCRSRPSSRTPTSRRSSASLARAAEARCLLRPAPSSPCVRGAGGVTRDDPARALPPHAPAPPDRGADHGALPAGPRSPARSTPAAGRRRSAAAAGLRARPRRRLRPAQPRARLPPRARRRRSSRGVPQLPRQGDRPHAAAATATCTSASPERGVFPLVSMLGDLCPVIVGAALAFKRRSEPRVALTFWGDGAMSTGDVARGPQPRRRAQGAGRVRAAVERLRLLDAAPSRQMVNPNMAERVRGRLGRSRPRASTARRARDATSRVRAAVERGARRRRAAAVEAVSLRLDGHAAHDDGSYMDQERLRTTTSTRLRSRSSGMAARLRLDGLVGGRGRRAARPPRRPRSRAGLAEAEAAPGARSRDARSTASTRTRADMSDAAAIAERVRAFVRDVVIPAEARDAAGEHGPAPELREELQAAARAAGLLAPHVGTDVRRARARRARPGARLRGGRLQPARPARAQLLGARRGQHAPARGGRERRSRRSATCAPLAAGAVRSCFAMTEPRARRRAPTRRCC